MNKKNIILLITVAGLIVGASALTSLAFNNGNRKGVKKVTVSRSFSKEVLNLSKQVKESDLIVIGKVTDIGRGTWKSGTKPHPSTDWSAHSIYHNVTISVKRVLKGKTSLEDDKVNITVAGGKAGNWSLLVTTSPKFKKGENVLLLLEKTDNGYKVSYSSFVKYSIKNGEAKGVGINQEKADATINKIKLIKFINKKIENHSPQLNKK